MTQDADRSLPTPTVVIGTSLTAASDAVVTAGIAAARALGGRAYVVHAYPLPAAYYGTPAGLATVHPQLLDAERAAQRQRLEAQLDRVGEASERPETVLEMGVAHRLLLDSASDLEADLLVVGATESTGPFAPLLGSTADRVLRKATVPVLVVRGHLRMPPRSVLAPIDLSPASGDVLRRGLALLARLHGGQAGTASVDPLFVLRETERRGSEQFSPDQIDRLAREELGRQIDAVDPEDAWHLRGRVRHGHAGHEILADLAERPVDIAMLGTHGHSGFERFLLGSVATGVAQRADCSVLVLPVDERGA